MIQPSEKLFAIVGAGQAGAWVARTLRTEGFTGRIVLIGAEPHAPYERPPLSKAILSGQATIEASTLLTPADAIEKTIEHWPATRVASLDPASKALTCADGRVIHYDHLFLTTGARTRSLPQAASLSRSPRVHELRTLDDAVRLRERLTRGGRIGVIGGGWIGLEVAATARRLGLDVGIIEAADRLCRRSVPAVVSDYLLDLHHGNGVEITLDAKVVAMLASGASVSVMLADSEHKYDEVVIGVGILPETSLAESAGLLLDNGIVVDEGGRTSDPFISAAGDVAMQVSASGLRARRESWANAQNQAIVAAKTALGLEARHLEVPWAWSDQYDDNIQIIGAPERASTTQLRGSPGRGSGAWLALDEVGRLLGAVAVNAPREVRLVRRALELGMTPDLSQWSRVDVAPTKIVLV